MPTTPASSSNFFGHRSRTFAGLCVTAAAVATSVGATTASAVSRNAAPDAVLPIGPVVHDDSANCSIDDVEVAFIADRIIVRTDNQGAVRNEIQTWVDSNRTARSGTPSIARLLRQSSGQSDGDDIVRYSDSIEFNSFDQSDQPGIDFTPVVAFDLPTDQQYDVLGLARHLDDLGLDAAPEYLTKLNTPYHFFRPDGLPIATGQTMPQRPQALASSANVDVMVFDSGLVRPPAGTLPRVSAERPIDEEVPDRNGDLRADTGWVGHGLAISSEISGLVPNANVRNVRVTRAGFGTDFTSAKAIADTLDRLSPSEWPDLLVASFGTQACDIDPTKPGDELMPVSLRAAAELLEELSNHQDVDMLLVAAAGNHGTDRREYPAAFDSVLAVGAIDASLDADGSSLTAATRTGPVAEFSARGSWVDLYAPGVDIVTAHVTNLRFERGARAVQGSAIVQGTSFSAPYVAAQLAELMDAHGATPSEALDLLMQASVDTRHACDGSTTEIDITGPSVALPSLSDPSDSLPVGLYADVCV